MCFEMKQNLHLILVSVLSLWVSFAYSQTFTEDFENCEIPKKIGDFNVPNTYNPADPRKIKKIENSSIGSPDIFHSKAQNNGVSLSNIAKLLPDNGNGVALAGFIPFFSDKGYYEYITVCLNDSLQIDETYQVKLDIMMSKELSQISIDCLEVFFSTDSVFQNSGNQIRREPHCKLKLPEKSNTWSPTSCTFVADSAYKFATLGVFSVCTPKDLVKNPTSRKSYYFIDNISISYLHSSNPAALSTSVSTTNPYDNQATSGDGIKKPPVPDTVVREVEQSSAAFLLDFSKSLFEESKKLSEGFQSLSSLTETDIIYSISSYNDTYRLLRNKLPAKFESDLEFSEEMFTGGSAGFIPALDSVVTLSKNNIDIKRTNFVIICTDLISHNDSQKIHLKEVAKSNPDLDFHIIHYKKGGSKDLSETFTGYGRTNINYHLTELSQIGEVLEDIFGFYKIRIKDIDKTNDGIEFIANQDIPNKSELKITTYSNQVVIELKDRTWADSRKITKRKRVRGYKIEISETKISVKRRTNFVKKFIERNQTSGFQVDTYKDTLTVSFTEESSR